MPAVFLPGAVIGAVSAVKLIKSNATLIRQDPGPMPLSRLTNLASGMRESDVSSISPLLASGTQAQVNTIVTRFVSGWGADPHTGLTAVKNALVAFYGPFRSMVNGIAVPVTYELATGLAWTDVTFAQLQTLHASLDNLLTAISVLE